MQYLSQRLAREPAKDPEERPPASALAASQRERILAATERLIGERGCAGASIEAIVKEAGVSSVTFYEHFAGKDECFVAAIERAVGELRDAVPAGGPHGADGMREALAALLAAIDADPARARLCFVEAQKGGPRLRARYDAELEAVADEIDDPLGPAIAGGVAWLIRERLELGGGDGVGDLLPKLTETVIEPYLAHA
jgi:AcrR family transcriptional regulator